MDYTPSNPCEAGDPQQIAVIKSHSSQFIESGTTREGKEGEGGEVEEVGPSSSPGHSPLGHGAGGSRTREYTSLPQLPIPSADLLREISQCKPCVVEYIEALREQIKSLKKEKTALRQEYNSFKFTAEERIARKTETIGSLQRRLVQIEFAREVENNQMTMGRDKDVMDTGTGPGYGSGGDSLCGFPRSVPNRLPSAIERTRGREAFRVARDPFSGFFSHGGPSAGAASVPRSSIIAASFASEGLDAAPGDEDYYTPVGLDGERSSWTASMVAHRAHQDGCVGPEFTRQGCRDYTRASSIPSQARFNPVGLTSPVNISCQPKLSNEAVPVTPLAES